MRTHILEGSLPRTIFGCQENLSVHTQKQQLKMWNSKGKNILHSYWISKKSPLLYH